MVISGTMLHATQHATAKKTNHATAHSHAYKSTTTTPTNDIDTIDTSTNDTNFLAYENSTLGMMILYPPDWKVAQAKDNNSSSRIVRCHCTRYFIPFLQLPDLTS
jgi:hypothetical protein